MTEITRFRGDTYADQFTLKDSAGVAIDISGYSFTFTLNTEKSPADTANEVYQLTGTITDAPGGKFEFAPSAVQADQVGTFFYDVQMIDGGGGIRTLAKDKYKYTQDITKI
jgi:hypothetical protein